MTYSMKSTGVAASVFVALSCSSAMAGEKRAADAHEHGHGTLNVALEGDTLGIEIEAPGADILGFEYEAKSDEDKAMVALARKILADPAPLVGLPVSAGCSVTEAEIEIGADGEGHEDDDDHDHEHEHEHDEEEGHSEVHAHYTLTCADPAAIKAVDLGGYFAAFPNAEEVDAAVLTDDGQSSGELTPDSSVLTF